MSPNKAYRPLWLSTLIDLGPGCVVVGFLLIVWGLPQVTFPILGTVLIVVGVLLTVVVSRLEKHLDALAERRNGS
jgi:hypothetical protein